MVESSLYKQAVDKFGKNNQLAVAMGEMAECSAEIAKIFINQREVDEKALLLEIADVAIMMKQMEVIYGQDLIDAVNTKLKKVKYHVENN